MPLCLALMSRALTHFLGVLKWQNIGKILWGKNIALVGENTTVP